MSKCDTCFWQENDGCYQDKENSDSCIDYEERDQVIYDLWERKGKGRKMSKCDTCFWQENDGCYQDKENSDSCIDYEERDQVIYDLWERDHDQ